MNRADKPATSEVVAPAVAMLGELALRVTDFAAMRVFYRLCLRVTPKEFPFFHWRALFVTDPDGNTVEFVCYDPKV